MAKNKSERKYLFNVVTVLLSLVLVFLVFHFIKNIRRDLEGHTYELYSMTDDINSHRYGDLLAKVYQNELQDVETDEIARKCYAVARYYEAALLHMAYEEGGKTEKAAGYEREMKEQEAKMGSYQNHALEIQKLLSSD